MDNKTKFYIQNIFDALNPNGNGVDGLLKLKCLQLQNRGLWLARTGDTVVLTAGCPRSYVKYVLDLTNSTDIVELAFDPSNSSAKLDAMGLFKQISMDANWKIVQHRQPKIEPYIKSAVVYKAAKLHGIVASNEDWQVYVNDHLAEQMNDKAIFHSECESYGVPIPRFWITTGDELPLRAVETLNTFSNGIYIRPTRSGGALQNLTVVKDDKTYSIPEKKVKKLTAEKLQHLLNEYYISSEQVNFIITELLDLYASPGTLFFINDSDVKFISHTLQILDSNNSFIGFSFPIEDETITMHFPVIESKSLLLLEPWRKKGFRGFVNVDWMITRDKKIYVAERNARQTAVVPPLTLASRITQSNYDEENVGNLKLSILTRDGIKPKKDLDFDSIITRLKMDHLLYNNQQSRGAVIITPPLLPVKINSVGIAILGQNKDEVFDILNKVLISLDAEDEKHLFTNE